MVTTDNWLEHGWIIRCSSGRLRGPKTSCVLYTSPGQATGVLKRDYNGRGEVVEVMLVQCSPAIKTK